jgi:hypothetical protein
VHKPNETKNNITLLEAETQQVCDCIKFLKSPRGVRQSYTVKMAAQCFLMRFVETNSATTYGVALKIMSLLCQNIFRNAKAGFVKLWSPVTQILRKERDEFTHHLDVVSVICDLFCYCFQLCDVGLCLSTFLNIHFSCNNPAQNIFSLLPPYSGAHSHIGTQG